MCVRIKERGWFVGIHNKPFQLSKSRTDVDRFPPTHHHHRRVAFKSIYLVYWNLFMWFLFAYMMFIRRHLFTKCYCDWTAAEVNLWPSLVFPCVSCSPSPTTLTPRTTHIESLRVLVCCVCGGSHRLQGVHPKALTTTARGYSSLVAAAFPSSSHFLSTSL